MAERSNAAVLKTVEVKASGGSNPSLSAFQHFKKNQIPAKSIFAGIFLLGHHANLSKILKKNVLNRDLNLHFNLGLAISLKALSALGFVEKMWVLNP